MKLNDRLKRALNKVKAEEDLKDRTKKFLYQKTKTYTRRTRIHYRSLIPAVLCFLLLITGGYRLYFTATVEISIDLNPSIELGVNRFDKIIAVKYYNSDGQRLADSLDIKYLDYTCAINQILASEEVQVLLLNDEVMTIGVIGEEDAQSAEVLSLIESCTESEKNTYCYFADLSEVEKAHEIGLSYGKYRAYSELQNLDPSVTAEEVRNMTMREIRDLIHALSEEYKGEKDSEDENRYGGYGFRKGRGNSSRNRYGMAEE